MVPFADEKYEGKMATPGTYIYIYALQGEIMLSLVGSPGELFALRRNKERRGWRKLKRF